METLNATEQERAKGERDREVLKRFANGKKVEGEEEYEIVTRYEQTGITHIGYSFTKQEIQASLTKIGKGILGLTEEKPPTDLVFISYLSDLL
ncbi:MAG: hypothetical protein HY764_02215 [Candidatus Portnoybacteria bacterium]|nr:hypothetical protein [Candidatus Portnoybacteria bacterium]